MYSNKFWIALLPHLLHSKVNFKFWPFYWKGAQIVRSSRKSHLSTFTTLSCSRTYQGISLMYVLRHFSIIYKKEQSRVAHAQMFLILSLGVWKCFYRTFDWGIKFKLKSFKSFWRYKEYKNSISTKCKISMKWNSHPTTQIRVEG